MRVVLVTAENRFIKAFRRGQLNNFVQLTMPYLAGFVRPPHTVALFDEHERPFAIPAIVLMTRPVQARTHPRREPHGCALWVARACAHQLI